MLRAVNCYPSQAEDAKYKSQLLQALIAGWVQVLSPTHLRCPLVPPVPATLCHLPKHLCLFVPFSKGEEPDKADTEYTGPCHCHQSPTPVMRDRSP